MGISLIHITHIGLYVIGANLYDIKQYANKGRHQSKRKSKMPLVSVVIAAHNEEANITKTIQSVADSTYPNIEIIIVNDGSTDNTSKVTRNFMNSYRRKHKKCCTGMRFRKMSLINQVNKGKAHAVNNGIEKKAKGTLVMTLDADSMLDSKAIQKSVNYFVNDRNIIGVAANVRIMDDKTILGVLQKIEHLIGYRTKKFFTVTNCEMVVGGVASTYRRRVLKEVGYYDTDTLTEDIGLSMKIIAKKGNKKYRIIYASDVLAGTEGVQTYKALFKQRYRWKMGMLQNLMKYGSSMGELRSANSKTLSLYRLPMAYIGEAILLIEPFILGYLIYLSIVYSTIGALIGAYMIITGYVILNLISDEHMRWYEKLKFGLFSPYMYFVFYIMNAVQVVAIVRCLFNFQTVTGKVRSGGPWISPERAAAKLS